ncbi:arylmalonate decarboxylase [Chromatiales bacterium (ex Bugula neritina AB1)]|nr:arylmalonate decarboxylase [Chromatiales bacterium (ex Bugula neritina AB1)]
MYQLGQAVQSKNRTPHMGLGRHHRARLGFILMSTDLACEADIMDMAPEGVGIHITRLKTDDYTTNETLARHIDGMADAASRIQPDMKPNVISYSCTSGSIVCREENVFREIRKGAPWAQPMSIVTGVLDALRELNAKKIVVATPYLDEVNSVEARYLLENGIDVLDIQGLQLKTGIEFGQVEPSYWKEFALDVDQAEADAIFLSCGGIRSLEVVEEIEQAAGKPVITSNQAQMWSCLRRASIVDELHGFGQLLKQPGRMLNPTI